ncbi:MAG: hypothetical protein QOI13_3719 [Paraburkholderia sp.]|nr:hypothetical protein [Paraburkholderia sp.]
MSSRARACRSLRLVVEFIVVTHMVFIYVPPRGHRALALREVDRKIDSLFSRTRPKVRWRPNDACEVFVGRCAATHAMFGKPHAVTRRKLGNEISVADIRYIDCLEPCARRRLARRPARWQRERRIRADNGDNQAQVQAGWPYALHRRREPTHQSADTV